MCAGIYQLIHDFAGPVATVIAAGAAVVVTWRLGRGQLRIAEQQAATATEQARVANVRLQHDLFDRRFAVFAAARDLCLEVFGTGKISDDLWSIFIRDTEKTVFFLFDRSVTAYIERMRNQGGSLKYAAGRLADRDLGLGPERTKMAEVRAETSKWFFDQFDVLIEVFKPALALEKDIETRIPRPAPS